MVMFHSLRSKICLGFELARWRYFPVGILPVILGAAIAWHEDSALIIWKLVLTVIGIFFAHLGANAANDCFDYLSGVDQFAYDNAPELKGSGVCGSDILTSGKLTIREGFAVVGVFFLIAFVIAIVLTITSGWLVFILAIAGFVLGLFYCAPPIAFGYIGYGLGELAILLTFGPLPVIGSYYIQTGHLSWNPVIASLPIGLYTVAIVFNQHFAHAEADKAGGKLTPVVVLGEKRMRRVSTLMLILIYVSIVIAVCFGIMPIYALITLTLAPIIIASSVRIGRTPASTAASLLFLFKIVKFNILTGILIILAFIV